MIDFLDGRGLVDPGRHDYDALGLLRPLHRVEQRRRHLQAYLVAAEFPVRPQLLAGLGVVGDDDANLWFR